jgi:hypothetical protein
MVILKDFVVCLRNFLLWLRVFVGFDLKMFIVIYLREFIVISIRKFIGFVLWKFSFLI